ncbi:ABC transporter ATP-binding protein [Ancylomarina sp. DW003]|nr:ABC transporter ATP-binding protein [Ancylomarina sp. DW003]MDE5421225.1 ABC transporter ATP-binding protein [Ancylomarina sp. DW003]
MLKANELSKSYKEVKALSGISLKVKKGELYGLLGPNGAGKSTCINILSSLIKPDSGEVFYDGKSLSDNRKYCRQILGVVPQEIALYEDLSAFENLMFWGKLYGIKGKALETKIDELLKMLGLFDRRKHKVKTYSGGMKRRINIAAALLHDPEIVFMDEPTVGIDPQSRNLIFEVIEQLHAKGLTMIYTTHYMEEAERLCDRIGIIDEGKIFREGTLAELRKASSIKEEIKLKFSNPEKNELIDLKEKHEQNLIVNEHQLVLSSNQSDVDLPLLIQGCLASHLKIENISISNVNLESIFLELTGKSLRD